MYNMQMYIWNSKQHAVCKLRCSGVPIESFIRVLLVLFCLALSLLAPGGIMSNPKDYREKERHVQCQCARLDEGAVLHADEPVLEQVALRLPTSVHQRRPSKRRIRTTANGTYLQCTQTFAQLFAELDVNLTLGHLVLPDLMSSEALFELFLH